MTALRSKIILFLKGIAMGAADVVPGVSGGTIAFISGIYEELLGAISSINHELIPLLKKEGIPVVWKKINGNFLITLFAGIAISFVSLAHLISYLIQYQPVALWSFFFGLILASVFYVGRGIDFKKVAVYPGLIVGAVFVLWLSIASPLPPSDSLLFLFGAGFVAICAMILPGISGSFILLLIGAYATVIQAIKDFDIAKIASVALGAGIGLISFSRVLNWLLKKYHNSLLAVLTGFLIGSLWKIWPWKIDPWVYHKTDGKIALAELSNNQFASLSAYLKHLNSEEAEKLKSFVEQNVLPQTYQQLNSQMDAQVIWALVFCALGFGLIFIIEYVAKSMKS